MIRNLRIAESILPELMVSDDFLKWARAQCDPFELTEFMYEAADALEFELLKHPDLPEQAHDYVCKYWFLLIVSLRREQEIKAAREENEFLKARLNRRTKPKHKRSV